MNENAKNEAVRLFHRRDPESAVLLDESHRENDDRAAYLITDGGRKTVLKLAANAFTTIRRIEGWDGLIRETRARGVYSPALLPSLNGRPAETLEADGKRIVVWEEEFAPYPLAQGRDEDEEAYRIRDAARPRSSDGSRPAWQEELILFYAEIGAAHLRGGWGPSMYVRLEAPEGDEWDEAEECVLKFEKEILARFPAFAGRWQTVRRRWEENRDALAAVYPRLPASVFQADWNDTNVLLTEDGHFAGLIDYNISGEDTVLNMAVSIGTYGFNASPDGAEEGEKRLRDTLRLFSSRYPWNEDEIAAAPLLWHYLNALYWGEVNDLRNAQSEDEAAALLTRVEESLARSVSFEDVMRGRAE